MRIFLLLCSVLIVGGIIGRAHPAEAAMTLRTSTYTIIDSINSLSLESSKVKAQPTELHQNPVGLYLLNFSLQTFNDPISIPSAITRNNGTLEPHTLGFNIESIKGEKTDSGIAAGILLSETPRDSHGNYQLKEGVRNDFTALIAFSDTPTGDAKRVRITYMPLLTNTTLSPILLNESELDDLKTKYLDIF